MDGFQRRQYILRAQYILGLAGIFLHQQAEYTVEKLKKADAIIDQGLETIKNIETAARYYRDFHRWKTAVEKYPETAVAKEIQSSCDNIVDYEQKYPQIRETGHYMNRHCW